MEPRNQIEAYAIEKFKNHGNPEYSVQLFMQGVDEALKYFSWKTFSEDCKPEVEKEFVLKLPDGTINWAVRKISHNHLPINMFIEKKYQFLTLPD